MPDISELPTAPNAAGERVRGRQQRSDLVERVALELFTERGLDAVTAEDIANAAGISRRTFFRYFPGGKEEVVLAELRRQMDTIQQRMAGRPPQEPAVEALRASVLAMADHFDGLHDEALMRARIAESSPMLSSRVLGEQIRLQEALIQMVALRLAADPSTDLRPGVIVATSLAATDVAMRTWLLGSDRSLSDLVAEALDLTEAGLEDIGTRQEVAGQR